MYVILLLFYEKQLIGQSVLRCQQPNEKQCRFFLWEKDEVAAREQNASHLPAPQTPTNKNLGRNVPPFRTSMFATPGQNSAGRPENHPESLPTPDSRDGVWASNDRTSRPVYFQSPDVSPTPRRFNDFEFKSDEDADLSTTVLGLLRSEKLELKTSTEVHLRHTISSQIAVYETRLRKSEATISELYKKLDELERDHTTKANA